MCGIGGLWYFGGASELKLRADARALTDAIAYRGPDGDGHWVDAAAGIALGHRRLAIIDLSSAGFQPMASANERVVITYNGELYNTAEMAAELAMPFRGHSDTEVLVETIARHGIAHALSRANGLFAFAAFDRSTRTLHLARDRMGIKPLYYTRQNGRLAFASELKALRAVPGLNFTIDASAVSAYLCHGCVPAPRTIYREVAKLLPGERIEFAEQATRNEIYWDLAAVAKSRQAAMNRESFEDVVEHLDGLLKDAVQRQMVSDVPLGAFLSGGIDSSTVVALMRAAHRGPVKTFSIGFREKAFNEADHARAVAQHLGTEHTELILSAAEAQAVIPQLPAIYDEPFADSSQIPTYLVSKLARSAVTVALSGDGGDENFGGYTRYRGISGLWNALRPIPRALRSGGTGAITLLSPAAWDMLAAPVPRRVRPTHFGDKMHKMAGLLDADGPIEMYRRLTSQWSASDRLMIAGNDSQTWLARLAPMTEGLGTEARLRLIDMLGYLPDDILTKVDRASMAVSLEVRVPLLDHRVVEYAWGLPADVLIARGETKRPLRAVLRRYVPDALFDRPKMGFGVPIGEWLRGPLRAWAEELIAPRLIAEQGLFDAAVLRQRWDEHMSGRRNWQHALWTVLQFQAWRQTYR